ncbi:MAG: GNAT family N-acetyltransferase [Rhodocyclaceae bacterium]|nr:GNAT family N-acetyltransferase [Rhodocyclaceae bacterium]
MRFCWLSHPGFYRDFADYLLGFSAEKRRKNSGRAALRRCQSGELRIPVATATRSTAPLWRTLYRPTALLPRFLRHAGHPAFKLEFFRRVGVELGSGACGGVRRLAGGAAGGFGDSLPR